MKLLKTFTFIFIIILFINNNNRISCFSFKEIKTNDNQVNCDTISMVYYGYLKGEFINRSTINLFRRSNYLKFRIENGKNILNDSLLINKRNIPLKKILFSINPDSLNSKYWDNESNGFVRRVFFIKNGITSEVTIVGTPKKVPTDLIYSVDEFFKIINSPDGPPDGARINK